MTTILIKGVGINKTLQCPNGTTVREAIQEYAKQTGRNLSGMDFYSNGSKITDLDSLASSEILAVKSKHESAA